MTREVRRLYSMPLHSLTMGDLKRVVLQSYNSFEVFVPFLLVCYKSGVSFINIKFNFVFFFKALLLSQFLFLFFL